MKSISRNYFYNLSYQILTLLTPLITAPYIARTLGVNGIGEYSFSYSIVAYFVLLAGFGIPSYAQRRLPIIRMIRMGKAEFSGKSSVSKLFL
jgi:O-antigen/teichoic acid export membrane protein